MKVERNEGRSVVINWSVGSFGGTDKRLALVKRVVRARIRVVQGCASVAAEWSQRASGEPN